MASMRDAMKIHTPSPVKTAQRVRQLASAFPMECARALSLQPDAIPNVGRALAHLADETPAATLLTETLRRRPDLMRCAHAFYDRCRELEPPLMLPLVCRPEITTSRDRP